jgi:hypothetical protein
MDQKRATVSETSGSEHAPDNGELKLEIKVLRSKLRTSLKGGTAGGGAGTSPSFCPVTMCTKLQ